MIALQKELSMDRQRRFSADLCGPYLGEEFDARQVRCWLQVGQASVSVLLPSDVLREPSYLDRNPIVLRVPNQRSLPVEAQAILTESQQKRARGWTAEMEYLDRF
jgi:hypothetical protein